MLVMEGPQAWRQIFQNVREKSHQMPHKTDSTAFRDGAMFPVVKPKFRLARGSRVFTIGSCFARNVETQFMENGFIVPVAEYTMIPGELDLPAPHLLNEYNAGTIIQRLESVAGTFDYGDKGIEIVEHGALDMFLHLGSAPVTAERLQERRAEIGALYRKILTCDVVVITLGLVESWYDTVAQCYLNRAPTRNWVKAEPDRFQFHRMDVEDVYSRMSRAIELLNGMGVSRVLVTVSPIPVEATFMPDSCPIANGYSKAALRVCAELLSKRYDCVSYFPSLEIVSSLGSAAFQDDNTHIHDWVVEAIMSFLFENYVEPAPVELNKVLKADHDTLSTDLATSVSQISDEPATVLAFHDKVNDEPSLAAKRPLWRRFTKRSSVTH